MSDIAWIDAALTSARPQALAALLRYFRDLETAEEAWENACLRALSLWPLNGPPRDPAAWLVFVARNAASDVSRGGEVPFVERVEDAHAGDDVLRLLFLCCHPELQAAQQITLALRVVSGLSVKQIARAFLVSESAIERRIAIAKRHIASRSLPPCATSPSERDSQLTTVAAMIYLIFNEGYSAGSDKQERRALCTEAIRVARILLRLFSSEPELMGLAALLLLQHSRADARFDAEGGIVLLPDQDRSLWNRAALAEGLALVDKAARHRSPGPYQVQASIAAVHARARHADDTRWAEIDEAYALLERMSPSPVVTLNRAVAVSKTRGCAAALTMIEPLAESLSGYFHFFGVKGALLHSLGRRDEARDAFGRALSLANSFAEAAHIRTHLDVLTRESTCANEKSNAPCRIESPSIVVDETPREQTNADVHRGRAMEEKATTTPNVMPPVRGGVTAYLNVRDASATVDFYKRAFGAEEVFRLPPNADGRTTHVHLYINGSSVMLTDMFPDEASEKVTGPQCFTLHLEVDDVEAWWRRAVAAGVEVVLPLQDMFWGARYGDFRDPFGVRWSMAAPIR